MAEVVRLLPERLTDGQVYEVLYTHPDFDPVTGQSSGPRILDRLYDGHEDDDVRAWRVR